VRRLSKDRSGQTAMADAVMTLVILMVASVVLYSAVAGAVSSRSEAVQRADLRAAAMGAGSMPMEASVPSVNFTNLSSGEVHWVHNITGGDMILTYFELGAIDTSGEERYDRDHLVKNIKDLYQMALLGRGYAVLVYCDLQDGGHMDLFFTSEDGNTVSSPGEVPHPRVVTRQSIYHPTMDVNIDLYIWK